EIIRQRLAGPQLQHAVMYLARMGNLSQLHEIESLLGDATEMQSHKHKSVTTFSTRVQDVALVALLHMTGQDPSAYGFSELREDRQTIYQLPTIGFGSEEERRAALTRWKRWSRENLKAVQPFVEQAAAGYSA
ncbi:MAG: hypothetical protein JNG89_20775, partial [Planctomycetaceae bacterium]|nr:hypothetical protein [Planctomycetaceae bacterium]